MARILGVDIPRNKAMRIALQSLYGVGPKVAMDVLTLSGIDPEKSSNDIGEEEVQTIRKYLEEGHVVEGDLRREIGLNIKRLKDMACYRGVRHRSGLPLRGQSTKNNSRTRKGKRKTVANKKKAVK